MQSSCVVSHLLGGTKTWMLPHSIHTAHHVCQFLNTVEGCPTESIVLQCRGRVLQPQDSIPENRSLIAFLSLRGGKGGFGSMLRAIGAQIEKTTNKEACRDLSGRRLRDINQEKKLKEQLQKRAEKERERIANRKKKFDALKEEPKHIFNDNSFYKEQEDIRQSLFDSVDKGLKVAAQEAACEPSTSGATSSSASGSDTNDTGTPTADKGVKRKNTNTKSQPLKKRRFFDDLDESSDDSDEAEK